MYIMMFKPKIIRRDKCGLMKWTQMISQFFFNQMNTRQQDPKVETEYEEFYYVDFADSVSLIQILSINTWHFSHFTAFQSINKSELDPSTRNYRQLRFPRLIFDTIFQFRSNCLRENCDSFLRTNDKITSRSHESQKIECLAENRHRITDQ